MTTPSFQDVLTLHNQSIYLTEMKKTLISITLLSLSCFAQAQQTVKLQLYSNVAKADAPVEYALPVNSDIRSAVVTIDGKELPSQLDDLDGDGIYDKLAFVTPLGKKEKKTAIIKLYTQGEQKAYPTRSYAEIVLRNPKVKEKNSQNIYLDAVSVDAQTKNPYNVLHHHGVAFENELLAVRIYMDKRQTLDLYGKFHKGLELKQTQFYPSKEQKAAGFGDDVLWVGNTFGLGAFRGWDGQQPTMIDSVQSRTQRIVAQGPVRTIVEVVDKNWFIKPGMTPVTMTLRYILWAGHRDIDVNVSFNRDVSQYTFSTGIINVKNSQEYSDHKGIRGCWGTDWPANDTLNWKRETVGLAIAMPNNKDVIEQPANKDNYAFTVKMSRNFHYSLAYTSANEDYGFHSAQEWFGWLKEWRRDIDNPVTVEELK